MSMKISKDVNIRYSHLPRFRTVNTRHKYSILGSVRKTLESLYDIAG
jgi:hypothetical protein